MKGNMPKEVNGARYIQIREKTHRGVRAGRVNWRTKQTTETKPFLRFEFSFCFGEVYF